MSFEKGKFKSTLEIGEIRPLLREDLALLQVKRQPAVIQRLRDPHHRLARFIATGMRDEEAARLSGYSLGGVYRLRQDPAFQQLIAQYREIVKDSWADSVDEYHELATGNMLKAERQIAEHLDKADEEGELLPVKNLLDISRDAADRFGYGKKQTNVNVNVDFAAQLEKAIKRSGKTIEGVSSGSNFAPQPAQVGRPRPIENLRRRA